MSVQVDVGQLSCFTNNQRIIKVEGDTVIDCLKNLERQFPELKLFDKEGNLLFYFGIFVDGVFTYPEELNRPIKDGDKLTVTLLQMHDGG